MGGRKIAIKSCNDRSHRCCPSLPASASPLDKVRAEPVDIKESSQQCRRNFAFEIAPRTAIHIPRECDPDERSKVTGMVDEQMVMPEDLRQRACGQDGMKYYLMQGSRTAQQKDEKKRPDFVQNMEGIEHRQALRQPVFPDFPCPRKNSPLLHTHLDRKAIPLGNVMQNSKDALAFL